MGRPLAERMAERKAEPVEETPSVHANGKHPLREDVKPGQQIWVTIVRGETIRRNDDDWQQFHVATLVTEAKPGKGGVAIVSASLSEPMDRPEAEQAFQIYTADNVFPSEHEW